MPRNGAGIYSLPALNPVVTGTIISSTWANNTLNDIASALTQSVARDGQTPVTQNITMSGFIHINVGDATAGDQYGVVHQIQENAYTWCGTAGGTANAITITPDFPITAYVAGHTFQFIVASENTGSATVAVSGLATKTITKNGATPLSAGDLIEDSVVEIIYDGTNFQVNGGISSGSETFTNLEVTNELTVNELTFSDGGTINNFPQGIIGFENLNEELNNYLLSLGGGGGGSSGGVASGDGRLSLDPDEKVMLTDVTGVTSIYYVGGLILTLNDGGGSFSPFNIGTLSQALSDTTYSPAASAASKVYDIFGWKDTMSVTSMTRSGSTVTVTTSGNHNITTDAIVYIAGADQAEYNGYQTLTAGSTNTFTFTVSTTPATPATGTITAATGRISRGPAWRNGGQAVTGATNATPIVLTVTSSGLSDGDIVTVENVGGNTAANGEWEVTVSGNNVTLVGSAGNGSYVSNTGSIAARGTGTATTELEALGSSYVNAYDITNGPDAQMGTYLGTIVTNASNQLDWKLGSIATGGGEAWLGLWNVSNQVTFEVVVTEATASWTMGAGARTFGPMNSSTSNRISFVRGFNLSGVSAAQSICVQPGAGTGAGCTIAADSVLEAWQGQQGVLASCTGAPGGIFNTSVVANGRGNNFFGFHFLQGMEENSASVPASTAATPVFAGNLNNAHTGLYGVVLSARLTQ
jgi:hypothetical protein